MKVIVHIFGSRRELVEWLRRYAADVGRGVINHASSEFRYDDVCVKCIVHDDYIVNRLRGYELHDFEVHRIELPQRTLEFLHSRVRPNRP